MTRLEEDFQDMEARRGGGGGGAIVWLVGVVLVLIALVRFACT
jgi:hypothetical protein